MLIKISEINTNGNVRSTMDTNKFDSLKRSMSVVGQIQPVVVDQTEENKFTLIAGHRRLAVAQDLEWTHIEASMMENDSISNDVIQLAENVEREEMSFVDEVKAVAKYLTKGISIKEISGTLGFSINWVRHRLQFKNLRAELLSGLTEGNKDHAIFIAKHSKQVQGKAIADAKEEHTQMSEQYSNITPWEEQDIIELAYEVLEEKVGLTIDNFPWSEGTELFGPQCRGCKHRLNNSLNLFKEVNEGSEDFCNNESCHDKKLESVKKAIEDFMETHEIKWIDYSEVMPVENSYDIHTFTRNILEPDDPDLSEFEKYTSAGMQEYGDRNIDFSKTIEETKTNPTEDGPAVGETLADAPPAEKPLYDRFPDVLSSISMNKIRKSLHFSLINAIYSHFMTIGTEYDEALLSQYLVNVTNVDKFVFCQSWGNNLHYSNAMQNAVESAIPIWSNLTDHCMRVALRECNWTELIEIMLLINFDLIEWFNKYLSDEKKLIALLGCLNTRELRFMIDWKGDDKKTRFRVKKDDLAFMASTPEYTGSYNLFPGLQDSLFPTDEIKKTTLNNWAMEIGKWERPEDSTIFDFRKDVKE